MEGLISLTKKTTPSNYRYICEKNGGSLSDKVKYPYHDLAGRLLKAYLAFSKVLTSSVCG